MDSVKIISYNSTGFPVQRQEYIKKLQLFSDVICGQEHFQLKNCKYRVVNSFSSDFDVYFKPAEKSCDYISAGRPKGGLFIAWKKLFVRKVTRISTKNVRLQAAILEYENTKVFILNSYFPCDSQKSDLSLDEIEELTNLIEDISDLLKKYKADYDVPIILGDLNFDSRRFTSHVQTISQFFEDNSLFSVWDMFPVDFTYSCSQSMSIIDHFILPNNMAQIISDCGVFHDSENMSGHSPIYLKVDLLKSRNPVEKVERNPRLNWSFSSEEQRKYYSNCLDEKISQLNHSTSTSCKNIFCNDENHRADIDIFTENLLNAMVESAWVNLEQTKGTTGDQTSRAHTIPGWNDNVKPFQDEAKFWFSVCRLLGNQFIQTHLE